MTSRTKLISAVITLFLVCILAIYVNWSYHIPTVILDNKTSWEYSKLACRHLETCKEYEAELELGELETKFKSAFGTEQDCKGVRLITREQLGESSPQLYKVLRGQHWWLILLMQDPAQQQGQYSLSARAEHREALTFRFDNPHNMARQVCRVVQNKGGSVVD